MPKTKTAKVSKGNVYPKLHNAAWPGVVGKGSPGGEPCIDLDTMIALTVAADVDGVKFDGIDPFLAPPHFDIDHPEEAAKQLADKVIANNLQIGTVVAPIWGGSAIGDDAAKATFLNAVKNACIAAKTLRKLGVRPNGCVRIDTSSSVDAWLKDPEGNQKVIAATFTQACEIAASYDEVLACEGEICWGGIQSWRRVNEILEMVDRPQTLGFQADMAHSMLYLLGYNAPEDRLLPENFDWTDAETFDAAYKKMTNVLRHWTVDFHIAQNDGTVFGSGSHDKTGRHCLPDDPNGKLNITHHAGFWLRDEDGLTKRFNHVCWDGCMFPNATMMKPETWNSILAAMIDVRNTYGWK
jgi:hypothetical protein